MDLSHVIERCPAVPVDFVQSPSLLATRYRAALEQRIAEAHEWRRQLDRAVRYHASIAARFWLPRLVGLDLPRSGHLVSVPPLTRPKWRRCYCDGTPDDDAAFCMVYYARADWVPLIDNLYQDAADPERAVLLWAYLCDGIAFRLSLRDGMYGVWPPCYSLSSSLNDFTEECASHKVVANGRRKVIKLDVDDYPEECASHKALANDRRKRIKIPISNGRVIADALVAIAADGCWPAEPCCDAYTLPFEEVV